jgi:O-antigen/teichoic acid export membrane protein
MPLLWGSKYDNVLVARVLQVMTWSLLPFAITEVFASAMIASHQEVLYFVQKGITLAVKFVLTYFLTLKYGIIGPAIATLASLSLLLIGQLPFIVPRLISLEFKAVIFPFLKLLLVVTLTAVAFYAIAAFQVILATVASVGVFVGSFLALKIVADQDFIYFKKILKRKSRAK